MGNSNVRSTEGMFDDITAQNSKFAPNPAQVTHKTPARPAGAAANSVKSTGKPSVKSSSRYQNRDSIDLPEFPTDPEDEDSEEEAAKNWENSPALNQQLLIQEKIDPASVFGLPTEINLEEVFKSTERTDSAQTPWLVRLHQELIVLCG